MQYARVLMYLQHDKFINASHAGGVDKFKFDNIFSKSMGLYQELLNQY